ncbi:MAG: DUF5667 domain-containing protein [Patescibacteria group bacterium]
MNEKEFISKIKSLKSDIIINDTFFDSNKEKFLNFVSSEFASDNSEKVASSNNFDFFSFINRMKIPGLAIGASAIVFTTFGLTVSASLRAIPGDPLYSFKISMENARVAMTFDDSKSVNLQVQFAGNRIDELSMVMRSNRADKHKIASDLVDKIDNDLSAVPNKVVALNNDKKSLETTAKVFDDKINEYSDKLKEVKNVANNSGMSDLTKDIDLAYIKGNSVAVKTLNIVVQNIDLTVNNDVLKKDIINRVEKKVDNIKDVVDSASKTVVNNDNNVIINQSPLDGDDKNTNTNTNTNENGGGSTLTEQLQDMKNELQKAKIGLASTDMASVINNVDKGLNNTIISTVPLTPVVGTKDNNPDNINKGVNKDNKDNNNVDKDNKDGDVKMQFESGAGYGLDHDNEYKIESLWSDGK